MSRLAVIVLGLGMIASSSALAAERTVTLAVQNMFCADCPFIVKKSLEAVPGVAKATVSFKDKTATVTYDDGKADIKSLAGSDHERGLSLHAEKLNVMILKSVITFPECGTAKLETMPTNACQFFYVCTGCGTKLRPKSGDCCVFCSYGSAPCWPMQSENATSCCTT